MADVARCMCPLNCGLEHDAPCDRPAVHTIHQAQMVSGEPVNPEEIGLCRECWNALRPDLNH
jgi:hypothetical protein